MLLSAERSVLVVIDVQERLAPAMHDLPNSCYGDPDARAAQLEVPMIMTEQYPKGLGRTVEGSHLAPAEAVVEKISFPPPAAAASTVSGRSRSRRGGDLRHRKPMSASCRPR